MDASYLKVTLVEAWNGMVQIDFQFVNLWSGSGPWLR